MTTQKKLNKAAREENRAYRHVQRLKRYGSRRVKVLIKRLSREHNARDVLDGVRTVTH